MQKESALFIMTTLLNANTDNAIEPLVYGRDPKARRIAMLVSAPLEEEGYDLVRVQIDSARCQIMIERLDSAPLSTEDCARATRVVLGLFDETPKLRGKKAIEVSSPGLARPLTRRADFARFQGELARIALCAPLEGRKHFSGRLAGFLASGKKIQLEDGNNGQSHELMLDDILYAQLRPRK